MFRYSAGIKPKSKELEYVVGWRESQLLKTLEDNLQRRKNYVVSGGIEVEIDVHFIEAFMRSLNVSGFMDKGVRLKTPLLKGGKIKASSATSLLKFLQAHHERTPVKMPYGSLNLLMSLISQAPYMYSKISLFEKQNSEVVKNKQAEKMKFRIEALEKNVNSQIGWITDKYEERIESIDKKYEELIDKAYDINDVLLAEKLSKEVLPDIKESITNNYIESIEKINAAEATKKESILQHTRNTYAFDLMGFDILVKKTGKDKLRFATIYDVESDVEPSNVFLYIVDYGDEEK